MKINSITLINIRSYLNETIYFGEGVNFISGANGTGKTTIVESIGFAIFDAKPDFGRDVTQFGYFVRYGCTSGTIRVEIEDNKGEEYIFERKISKKNTSWTVYEKESGMELNLHGSDDVKEFIKEHIDIDKNQKLEDVFANIIGVSQGSFTMPFLLAPADRIKHFNTILNVLEYRKAADKGLETKNYYNGLIIENEKNIAILIERLSNKEQVEKDNTALKSEVSSLKEEFLISEKNKQELKEQVDGLNALKNKFLDAEKSVKNLQAQILTKDEAIKIQTGNLINAQDAKKVIMSHKEAYDAYKNAQGKALLLEKKKEQKEQLLRKKIENGNKYNILISEANNKIDIYKNRQELLKEQISKANKEINEINCKIEKNENDDNLAKSTEVLNNINAKTQQLYECISQIEMYNDRIKAGLEKWKENELKIKQIEAELEKEADLLVRAKLYEDALSKRESVAARKAVLENDIELQKGYLSEIEKGVCPVCHENCADIDKIKNEIMAYLSEVENELNDTEKKAEEYNQEINDYKEDYERAISLKAEEVELTLCFNNRAAFSNAFSSLSNKINDIHIQDIVYYLEQDISALKELMDTNTLLLECPKNMVYDNDPENFAVTAYKFISECRNIYKSTADVVNEAKGRISNAFINADKQKTEYQKMIEKQRELIEKLQEEIKGAEESVAKGYVFLETKKKEYDNDLIAMNDSLKEYEDVDTLLEANRQIIDSNKKHYELYMNNLNIANKAEETKGKIEVLEKEKAFLSEKSKVEEDRLISLKAQFSEEMLSKATEAYTLAIEKNAKALSNFEQKENELNKNEQELQRLGKEQKALDTANANLIKLKKSRAFAKIIFDDVLKNAGEKIGGIYRQRLTSKSNDLFKEMTSENAELIWEDDYNVTILDNYAGEKRQRVFRQLSGGEQMAAALSIRLAFIAALTHTRIAFFDEPTTNLDSERRNNLAEILPKVVNDFTQVFVISHDDTFDSVTQNLIKLQKTKEGTRNS